MSKKFIMHLANSNMNNNINTGQAAITEVNCAFCNKDVKKYVSCLHCNSNYHPSCALRVVGLRVLLHGIMCCDGSSDVHTSSKRSRLTPSPSPISNIMSSLEIELMKKLMDEMSDKNKCYMKTNLYLSSILINLTVN